MKRLYLEGHNIRKGQAVSVEYQSGPPVRFYQNLRYARKVVERFNRRFGQIPKEYREAVSEMMTRGSRPISDSFAFAILQHRSKNA